MNSNAKNISLAAAASLLLHLAATIAVRLASNAIDFENSTLRLLFSIAGALICLCTAYFSYTAFSRQLGCGHIACEKNPDLSPSSRIALILLCASAIILFGNVYASMFPDASSVSVPGGAALFDHVLMILSYVLIPAFFEELVFRGCFTRDFSVYGQTSAVILSALLFGLTHFSFSAFPYAFICGIIIGAAYVTTGSLYVAVGIHFLCNLSGYVMSALGNAMTQESYGILEKAVIVAFAAVAAASGIFLMLKLRKVQPKKEKDHVMSWEFLTSLMVFYLVCAFAAHIFLG